MAEPRQCPGCGDCGKVEIQRDAWVGRAWCVVCTNCYDGAEDSRPFVAWGDTEAEAVEAWNEYVADELDEPLTERLVSDTEPLLSAERDTRESEAGEIEPSGSVIHFPGGSVDTTGWPEQASGKTSRATPEEIAALEAGIADTEPPGGGA